MYLFVDMNTKAVELESGVAVNDSVTYAIRTSDRVCCSRDYSRR